MSKYKFFIFSMAFLISACHNPSNNSVYIVLTGETMGTTYNIKYKGIKNYKDQIDKELKRINDELSTYIQTSTISRFNRSDSGIIVDKTDFLINLQKAEEVYILSDGLYDPTVMPLVNYWGFGYEAHKKIEKVDTLKIKKLLKFIGLNLIKILPSAKNRSFIFKPNKDIQLDFSSIAKGYGVDKIGQLLGEKKITDFMVEIGGEIVSRGLSPSGKNWVIGINTPSENASPEDFMIEVGLSGKGLATSGNYRNYYGEGKERYSHTINPKTGFPERSNLLSATIIASDCMTADALATACMVSGLEKSKKMIASLKNVQACFIWVNENNEMKVFTTPGFTNQ